MYGLGWTPKRAPICWPNSWFAMLISSITFESLNNLIIREFFQKDKGEIRLSFPPLNFNLEKSWFLLRVFFQSKEESKLEESRTAVEQGTQKGSFYENKGDYCFCGELLLFSHMHIHRWREFLLSYIFCLFNITTMMVSDKEKEAGFSSSLV